MSETLQALLGLFTLDFEHTVSRATRCRRSPIGWRTRVPKTLRCCWLWR